MNKRDQLVFLLVQAISILMDYSCLSHQTKMNQELVWPSF